MKNALIAIGMIAAGAVLLLIVLPIEAVREIRWRFGRRKSAIIIGDEKITLNVKESRRKDEKRQIK